MKATQHLFTTPCESDRFIKNSNFILFVIFLEGFASISIEILTIRQLIPVAGTSVIVTSLIIGVFLLFLAIGYWRGGLHKENFTSILRKNFIIGACLAGLGLSYPFIIYFFSLLEQTNNLLFVLTSYLLLIIAPTIYFIGQTVPLSLNLMPHKERASKIGGKVLFLSTIGSFLGAPLTTLVFMEFFGVAWSVFINFLILMTLALLFSEHGKRMVYITLSSLIGWFVYQLNVSFEQNYFITTTNYANYRVSESTLSQSDSQKGKILSVNDSSSSFINSQHKTFPYNELIKRILFQDLKLHKAQILVLGAGGFTLSAENSYGNYFTYVDIDPKIKSITEKNFLSKINGKFIAQDARTFIKDKPNHYDVIVSDTYSNLLTIPSALSTREYFNSIRASLKQGGFAIFNIIAYPFFDDPYSKRIDSTIRSAFGNCVATPLRYSNKLTNIIYVCKYSPTANDRTIYTDNLNKGTLDSMSSVHLRGSK